VFERIFGRRNGDGVAPPADGQGERRPAPKTFPDGVTCGAGCGRTSGYRCSYVDPTGRQCGYWCEEHSAYLHRRNWCQRHANSVKWIHARDGSIYEIGRQALLDDRSPNLVATLVDELNADVTTFLAGSFRRHRGVQIVTDAHIRTAQIAKGRVEHTPTGPMVLHEASDRAWERGWGVFSHVGYLARVILRVTATEPPVVHVVVNGVLTLRRVPDWIANRGKGTNPEADRATFRKAVLDSIRGHVMVPQPPPE
jgi:hypothetical protein